MTNVYVIFGPRIRRRENVYENDGNAKAHFRCLQPVSQEDDELEEDFDDDDYDENWEEGFDEDDSD